MKSPCEGDAETVKQTAIHPGEVLADAVELFRGTMVRHDRASAAGKLDRSLDEGPKRGWTVVSMKKDWKRVFSFETK